MQRIEINNFGPIAELKLDIKDFMLLIGPQASGKSTIAKTIFFFKSFHDDLVRYFLSAFEQDDFSKPLEAYTKMIRQKFLDYFGATKYLPNLHLKYFYDTHVWISITLESRHSYITPKFSNSFEKAIEKLAGKAEKCAKSLKPFNPSLLTSKDLLQTENTKREFISQITKECHQLFGDDRELLFIPAGRSLLATLADQLQFIEPRKLDFLMRTFVSKINLLKPIFNQSLSEIIKARKLLTQSEIDISRTKLAEKIIQKILKGKYQYDNDGEKLYYDSDKYVRLSFSSSGQQESLWILLLLFIIILEQQNVFVVIEEPEAHLFPEAQKEITALIALLSNMKQSQVIITTHSPYILASVNNLILANKIGKKHADTVSKKINKHIWLNRDKIFAALVQAGKVEEIIDPDFDIIQQEQIDSVSRIINEEFDFLYHYEAEENANV
jgi:predicted ATP-dependent endonuclease of OLD family